ncbi:MAG: hypothetical protein AB9869_10330 [Verrucomicrobiia bacterium]
MPGDRETRFRAFGPLFDNVFENKIVFRARIVVVMKLTELTLGPDGLRGRGKPTSWLHIPHHAEPSRFPEWFWFSNSRGSIALCGNHLISSVSELRDLAGTGAC